MVSFRSSWLLLLPLLGLTACDTPSPCGKVKCEAGRICNPATGACAIDPNAADAGPDAGLDAGTADGGVDAGVDAGAACDPACAAGTVCDPSTFKCVGCLGNADCSCPTPLCDAATLTCVAPSDAGFPQPLIAESCATAAELPFPPCAASTRFRVDLGPLRDDEQGTCSGAGAAGRDAVFLLTLDAGYDVSVSATAPAGSAAQPVTYLRAAPCQAGAELVCRDALGGASSGFLMRSLPQGQYALVIDQHQASAAGVLDVQVDLLPPTLPSNDTCTTPLNASTDGGTVTIDLSAATDDLTGSCNGTIDSRDAVWRVDLAQPSDFYALARGQPDSGTDPVLYLRDAPCALDREVSCVDLSSTQTEQLRARRLDAGTYYLVVEGKGPAGSGVLDLTTWAAPPVPIPSFDTCAAPYLITFPVGVSTIRFTVDTSDFTDNERGSCGSFGGRDAIYQLTQNAGHTITVTTQPVDGGSSDPVVYLRANGCTDAGFEVSCVDEVSPTPEVLSAWLDAGTYFLVIDSHSSDSAGPTVVTVTQAP